MIEEIGAKTSWDECARYSRLCGNCGPKRLQWTKTEEKQKREVNCFPTFCLRTKRAEYIPQKSGARTRKHREKHKENGELPKPEEPGTGEMGGSEGLRGGKRPVTDLRTKLYR